MVGCEALNGLFFLLLEEFTVAVHVLIVQVLGRQSEPFHGLNGNLTARPERVDMTLVLLEECGDVLVSVRPEVLDEGKDLIDIKNLRPVLLGCVELFGHFKRTRGHLHVGEFREGGTEMVGDPVLQAVISERDTVVGEHHGAEGVLGGMIQERTPIFLAKLHAVGHDGL